MKPINILVKFLSSPNSISKLELLQRHKKKDSTKASLKCILLETKQQRLDIQWQKTIFQKQDQRRQLSNLLQSKAFSNRFWVGMLACAPVSWISIEYVALCRCNSYLNCTTRTKETSIRSYGHTAEYHT